MLKGFPSRPLDAAFDAVFPRYPISASVIDMIKAFAPVDRLLHDLYADQISYAGLTPVMRDYDNEYAEIVPSLAGWTSTIERMARRLDIPLDLSLLRRLGNRLDVGMLINVAELDTAVALISRSRAVFLAAPTHVRKAAVIDEYIEIAVEEYGLRDAA